MDLNQTLQAIVTDAVGRAVSAVNEDWAMRLSAFANAKLTAVGPGALVTSQEPLRLREPTEAVKRPTKAVKRNYPPHCIHDGCHKAHKGPRFSFLCEDHLGVSKASKKKLMEAWKNS